jgi:hypothetical protein
VFETLQSLPEAAQIRLRFTTDRKGDAAIPLPTRCVKSLHKQNPQSQAAIGLLRKRLGSLESLMRLGQTGS